jgi:hypothetical protein
MPPKRRREEETAGIYSRLRYQIDSGNGPEFETIADLLVSALQQCLREADDPALTNYVLDHLSEGLASNWPRK